MREAERKIMDTKLQEFKSLLKEKGYKMTVQRLAIFEALHQVHMHPTAEEIHQQVVKRYPIIGLSTVYNTLETLCQLGQVKKVSLDPGNTRYDIISSNHCHMVCLGCGIIEDVGDIACDNCKRRLEDHHQFKVEHFAASFFGYCQNCSQQSGHSPSESLQKIQSQ